MTETGVVKQVESGQAVVVFKRTDACQRCGACIKSDTGDMLVTVTNELNALPGQSVEVEMPAGRLLSASLIAYAVPLTALLLGILAGVPIYDAIGFTFNRELFSALCGILCMVGSFVFIRFADRKAAKRGMGMRITSVK